MDELTRREALKLGAAATAAASLAVGEAVAAPPVPAFFTAQEHAMLDELSEILVPTDAHSPGARAAKVAAYIDAQLAEAWTAAEKTTWRDGLKLVDALSRDMNRRSFLESSPDERLAVVSRMAQGERDPQKPEQRFFVELKSRVVRAYYTSEIGIRQEMEYKGNTYLPEFVGFDVSDPNVR